MSSSNFDDDDDDANNEYDDQELLEEFQKLKQAYEIAKDTWRSPMFSWKAHWLICIARSFHEVMLTAVKFS
jgi:hypothetical protein